MSDITKLNDISMVNDVPPMPQFSEHQHGPYIVTEWKYRQEDGYGDMRYSSASSATESVATKVRCANCLKEQQL